MQAGRNRFVGIVDYGAGNIQSIENAFTHLGAQVTRVHAESDLGNCTHLVLPGVGAFGFCAERLLESGLTPSLHRWALEDGRPLLGICVGMQLLADGSAESPGEPGLGWLGGRVCLMSASPGVRVPHVGWNTVDFHRPCGGFAPGSTADFYFDHSYAYGELRDGVTVGHCSHGLRFSAIIARDNIVAAQFHPEKSQSSGMRFLSGFLAS